MFYLYHVNTFAYHDLKDQLLIGRTTGQLVFGDDGRMSGKHALIMLQDNAGKLSVTIEDLGSKNLSVVNRIQIPPLQKVNIKPMCLLEIGSQQFILTENKTMSLEKLNEVMEHHLNKVIVKLDKETITPVATDEKVPPTPVFEDPIASKEKQFLAAEKELAAVDLVIKSSNVKRLELLKTMTQLKREVEEAKALKIELENKKKKIINLKDLGD